MTDPATVNLNIYQGQTFQQPFQWLDANSDPIVLTGYTAEMDVRAAIDDPNRIAHWSTTDGTITIDGPNGIFTINVTDEATFALSTSNELETWVYDLRLIAPDGTAERPVQGAIVLYPSVTRDVA